MLELSSSKSIKISIASLEDRGELIFAIVSDRISFDEYPGGIIKKHLLPTGFSENVIEKIKDLVKRALDKLEIYNGPAYFQIKVVDDEPYIIEVTPRLDGCHMWRLIKTYCNVDLLDISFKHLLGQKFTCIPESGTGSYCLEFMCQPPHTKIIDHNVQEGIYTRWYYDIGDEVRELNGYMEKCGYNIYKN